MPLRALIVEDEPLAARRLADMLARQPEPVQVLGTAESVTQAVALLASVQPAPDVLFLDIHLADGLSFDIFELTEVRCPVIFTTAYDQYALQAFKVNSVDYLLKPIDEEELTAALHKLRERMPAAQSTAAAPAFDPSLLAQLVQQMQQTLPGTATPAASYKTQFVVRVGEHLKVVPIDQIAYFFSLEKATFLQTTEGRKFVVDYTMDQLEGLLDPRRFFRLNRAYLAQQTAIQDIIHYTNSRLQTVLKPVAPDAQVLVSREKVNVFKSWLDR
ncbi:LytR/AlgR family response regulator transcription factor [Hymenobacter arizonensis]|uniref:DNA-binding response regulator, LytR/AlgR family n=1 Tax=Hymenobacter arizonensis TaxID=1227077 RepID=A0A1I5SJ75_HYMAR|nr:LytTR family DNA-binding domain-containing protein [Hymenobacter arizonensis]SFP70763.1 DNA-binding response regulator, LytR/AlgR family [Hymenobacter arizonensis]